MYPEIIEVNSWIEAAQVLSFAPWWEVRCSGGGKCVTMKIIFGNYFSGFIDIICKTQLWAKFVKDVFSFACYRKKKTNNSGTNGSSIIQRWPRSWRGKERFFRKRESKRSLVFLVSVSNSSRSLHLTHKRIFQILVYI